VNSTHPLRSRLYEVMQTLTRADGELQDLPGKRGYPPVLRKMLTRLKEMANAFTETVDKCYDGDIPPARFWKKQWRNRRYVTVDPS